MAEVLSKRERTTRLGMWIILVLSSEAAVLGLFCVIMVWQKIDISPAAAILAAVMNVLMVAIGAIAGNGLGLVAGDTARPSGSTQMAWKKDPAITAPPEKTPVSPGAPAPPT